MEDMQNNPQNNPAMDGEAAALRMQMAAKDKRIKELESREPVAIREVPVPPADYEQLKYQVNRQQKQIKKYQQLLAFGGTQNLANLIEGFADKAKSTMKKIALEIENTSYDQQQIQRIIKLCDFLDKSREELYSFVSTADDGKFISNPAFRRVQQDISLITARLNEKGTVYNIPEERLPEFHHVLLSVLEAIKPYLNEGEKNG